MQFRTRLYNTFSRRFMSEKKNCAPCRPSKNIQLRMCVFCLSSGAKSTNGLLQMVRLYVYSWAGDLIKESCRQLTVISLNYCIKFTSVCCYYYSQRLIDKTKIQTADYTRNSAAEAKAPAALARNPLLDMPLKNKSIECTVFLVYIEK